VSELQKAFMDVARLTGDVVVFLGKDKSALEQSGEWAVLQDKLSKLDEATDRLQKAIGL